MHEKIMVIADATSYALKREGYMVEVIDRGDIVAKWLSETRPKPLF